MSRSLAITIALDPSLHSRLRELSLQTKLPMAQILRFGADAILERAKLHAEGCPRIYEATHCTCGGRKK